MPERHGRCTYISQAAVPAQPGQTGGSDPPPDRSPDEPGARGEMEITMKRKLWVVLVGTSFLIPIQADAQRARSRRVPVTRHVDAWASGRLASCRAPSGGRAYVCRADTRRNVVYRYSGTGRARSSRNWVLAEWGDMHMHLAGRFTRSGSISQGRLRHMLGAATVRRVRDLGRRAGLRGSLHGHWVESRRLGAVLTLSIGDQEVAQFLDYDRDGLVDDVLLRNFRRW